jgi:hypothetical protein
MLKAMKFVLRLVRQTIADRMPAYGANHAYRDNLEYSHHWEEPVLQLNQGNDPLFREKMEHELKTFLVKDTEFKIFRLV